jgi:hypothetical protein
LFAGSLVGAASVPLTGLLLVLIFAPGEFAVQWRYADLYFLLLELAFAWCVFAAGLCVFGIPCWWVCHRMGWRSAGAALLLGFLLAFLVAFAINTVPIVLFNSLGTSSFGDSGGDTVLNGRLTNYGWVSSVRGSIAVAWMGGLTALVIWRVAYRRPFFPRKA